MILIKDQLKSAFLSPLLLHLVIISIANKMDVLKITCNILRIPVNLTRNSFRNILKGFSINHVFFFFFFNLQVALLFHSYHKCSESVFSFIRPAPLPFPILDNGITTSCSNQEPGSQTCLIPFPAPHQSLFHLFNISSILPQLPVSQNSFIEAYTSSLVEV